MKFRSRVIEGQKLARTLGVPTANFSFSQRPQIKNGVWLVRVRFDGKEYGGVLHAGVRQTDKEWAVEVHILKFDGNLLGQVLEVETIRFLRDTRKFEALSALEAQIRLDVVHARKFFLREKIKKSWSELSEEKRKELEGNALEAIKKLLEFIKAQMVYIYAPDQQEISFVQELCSMFPEKQFAFPFVRKGKMEFYISKFENLKKGSFDILEPEITNIAPSPDLIFVPAVAAALTGERLGRGGGFYDQFLCSTDAPTVCVLPEWAVLDDIPCEGHDVRVGRVIGV